MPHRAFIVTLDLPTTDPSTDAGIADEIKELLEHELAVVSVNPWATPSTGAIQAPSIMPDSGGILSPTQQPEQW